MWDPSHPFLVFFILLSLWAPLHTIQTSGTSGVQRQKEDEKEFIDFFSTSFSYKWKKLREARHYELEEICENLYKRLKSQYNRTDVKYQIFKLLNPEHCIKFYHNEHESVCTIDILQCRIFSRIKLDHLKPGFSMESAPDDIYVTEGNTDNCVFVLMEAQRIDLSPDEILEEIGKQHGISEAEMADENERERLLNTYRIQFPLIPNTFRVQRKLSNVEFRVNLFYLNSKRDDSVFLY